MKPKVQEPCHETGPCSIGLQCISCVKSDTTNPKLSDGCHVSDSFFSQDKGCGVAPSLTLTFKKTVPHAAETHKYASVVSYTSLHKAVIFCVKSLPSHCELNEYVYDAL